MKTIFGSLLICLVACMAGAQANTQNPAAPTKHHHKKSDGTNNPAGSADAGAAPATDPVADQLKLVQQYQKTFVPTDPWRVMSERTNFAKGPDWVQFEGRVTQASADGLVLTGWYGEPLAYMMPPGASSGAVTSGQFVLSNYPRRVAVGQLLSRNDRLVAMKAGTKNHLVNLDYGTVWVPEVTEEQKNQAAQAKSKTEAKVLAWQQEQADNGDAYGQYKMGLRYLNGDGVDKNPGKARDYLSKSAAQGNKDAADELAKIPAN